MAKFVPNKAGMAKLEADIKAKMKRMNAEINQAIAKRGSKSDAQLSQEIDRIAKRYGVNLDRAALAKFSKIQPED